MLLKSKKHFQILALVLITAIVYLLGKTLDLHPGVRISWINFALGVISAALGFLLFTSTQMLLLLLRGKTYELELQKHKDDFSKLEIAEIIESGIFSGTFYELLLRVGIFGFTLAKSSPLLAYPIAFISSYFVFLTKSSRFLPIAFAVFGIYSCFLYQLERSYFLIAICNSCSWISWLIYLKSSYFKRNCQSILDIRRKLTKKLKLK